jgi:transposase
MTKRTVTSYPLEFKKSSAKLAAESDESVSKIAKNLGVHVTTLHGWVAKFESNHKKKSPNNIDQNEELKQLRRENMRLRQERDILKKAAAFFASEM